MYGKLDFIVAKYEELSLKVSDPDIINDQPVWQKHIKEMSEMEPIVKKYIEYKKTNDQLAETKGMYDQGAMDDELRDMNKLEISELEKTLEILAEELQLALLPKDPNDDRNVILEIRAGAGGDEASIFVADVWRMYKNYFGTLGWKSEVVSLSAGDQGVKEIVVNVSGEKVYSRMKYESGVHRVQRVPDTEAQGRVHTSTITVAVMPEADEVGDVVLDMNEIRIDVYLSLIHI